PNKGGTCNRYHLAPLVLTLVAGIPELPIHLGTVSPRNICKRQQQQQPGKLLSSAKRDCNNMPLDSAAS
uniref:Uncharacterized protein n=1 Tax=Anopheles albimanus TaxID=7167 RepID=A0A182FVJ3_ANOAL